MPAPIRTVAVLAPVETAQADSVVPLDQLLARPVSDTGSAETFTYGGEVATAMSAAPVDAATAPEFVVENEQTFYAAAETRPAQLPRSMVGDPAPRVVAEPRTLFSAPRQVQSVVRNDDPAPLPRQPREGDGRYMVQIGAYSREASVELAWDRAVRKHAALSSYTPNRASFDHGRQLYRLAFGGFESRGDAAGLCRTLRSSGVDCFVRARAGDTPMQMAARATEVVREVAMAEPQAETEAAPREAAALHERNESDAMTPMQLAAMMLEQFGGTAPERAGSVHNASTPMEFASDMLIEIAQLV